MLADASQVQVGATEATVLPLVGRYGGYKWKTEPLSPREDWSDRDEYDYQKNLLSDYRFSLEVSPFGLLTTNGHFGQRGRVTQSIRATINTLPARLRAVFGLRDWGTAVDLSIRGGRVQSVSGMVLVEGRSRWLGHEWEFASAMPEHGIQANVFFVESGILEMENNGGAIIQDIFTPKASEEEVQTSRKFNTACLTSIRGCDGFCDFTPRTLEYLKQHPDAAGNIIPPKCP